MDLGTYGGFGETEEGRGTRQSRKEEVRGKAGRKRCEAKQRMKIRIDRARCASERDLANLHWWQAKYLNVQIKWTKSAEMSQDS